MFCIEEQGGDINNFLEKTEKEYNYIECQLWDKKYIDNLC